MRINDSMRDAFVRAVLQDTPKVDYAEQRRKAIQDHLFAIAPPDVLKMYKDPKTTVYFQPDHVTYSHDGGNRHSWGLGKFWLVPDVDGRNTTFKITDKDVLKALYRIDQAEEAQHKTLNELESKLRGVIRGFNTVKQARAALPEFVKYLPEDAEKTPQYVPAINDLVTDLVKAGWPDGGKPKAKAEAVCS